MDELDTFILRALQEDGRTPFAQIARQADVSEATVRSRYQALVDEGVIQTVGVVDPYALGFHAPALVAVSVEPGTVDQVARTIADLTEISYLVMTLGSADLMVEVFCRDLPHLTELVTRCIQGIPGVRSTETLMIAQTYKLSYRWVPRLPGEGKA